MTELQRYALQHDSPIATMTPRADGDWVLWDDVRVELSRLRELVAKLQEPTYWYDDCGESYESPADYAHSNEKYVGDEFTLRAAREIGEERYRCVGDPDDTWPYVEKINNSDAPQKG